MTGFTSICSVDFSNQKQGSSSSMGRKQSGRSRSWTTATLSKTLLPQSQSDSKLKMPHFSKNYRASLTTSIQRCELTSSRVNFDCSFVCFIESCVHLCVKTLNRDETEPFLFVRWSIHDESDKHNMFSNETTDVCGAFIFERLDTGMLVLKEKPVEAQNMKSSIEAVSTPSCGASTVNVVGKNWTVPDGFIKQAISATHFEYVRAPANNV